MIMNSLFRRHVIRQGKGNESARRMTSGGRWAEDSSARSQLTRSSGFVIAQTAGFLIVCLTMVEMFVVPRNYFIAGSLVSTSCMLCVALLLAKYGQLFHPSYRSIIIGVSSAVVLYLIFVGGNAAIKIVSPLGMSTTNESSIYALFASSPLQLKVLVFLLDAFGFESYFRGVLQRVVFAKLGVGSAFAVAAVDAAIHLSTLNPLFPVTTFIADAVWGINYYFSKDVGSNIVSHFLWDMLVFVILPLS